ncbi:MAG: acetate kinase [Bradymonadales bacterium]|jgi:acetate kinase
MKILTLNCGSSSIKYQFIAMPDRVVLAKGNVERIGEPEGIMKHKTDKGQRVLERPFKDHAEGLQTIFDLLTDNDPISDLSEISAIGHRIVHGGEALTAPCMVSEELIQAVEAAEPLDPLHVPAHVLGLRVASDLLPNVPMTAVFDTAFHQSMPPKAFLYAIPRELYKKEHIRKYGFHGTSHQYVSRRAAQLLGKTPKECNIITCHLGNGASLAAVRGGECIDTSMGLSPLEGVCMGTRSGDLDATVLTYLARTKGYNADTLDDLLNKKSGLLGLSGISNDCRVLEELAQEGNKDAILALDCYAYRIRKYIGSYIVALDAKVDAIVFTAGVGENSPYVRKLVCENLENIGIELDIERNNVFSKEQKISTDNSKVQLWVIPTNEEMEIAKITFDLVRQ